jgi:hypothetical protein
MIHPFDQINVPLAGIHILQPEKSHVRERIVNRYFQDFRDGISVLFKNSSHGCSHSGAPQIGKVFRRGTLTGKLLRLEFFTNQVFRRGEIRHQGFGTG